MRRSEDALVVRPHLEVDTHILPMGGGDFLAALISKLPLGEAAALGGSSPQDFDLSYHLAGLFENGVFANIQTERTRT